MWTNFLAGGNIKGGRVIGESDAKGAFPKLNPKSPQDVLATMYRHLGIDTEALYDTQRTQIAPDGPFSKVPHLVLETGSS